jgi:predicted amino acid dehydrogenase
MLYQRLLDEQIAERERLKKEKEEKEKEAEEEKRKEKENKEIIAAQEEVSQSSVSTYVCTVDQLQYAYNNIYVSLSALYC